MTDPLRAGSNGPRCAMRPRVLLVAAAALLVPGLCGCPPPAAGIAPRDEHQAVDRINQNLEQIRKPLQCKALVTFSFRDSDGHQRRFLAQQAGLLFEPPRSLRFEVLSIGGMVAQFGSNKERYWVLVDPEVHKLWFGEWSKQSDWGSSRLPVPPDQLLDALMLRPLPAGTPIWLSPLLRLAGPDQRLVLVRRREDGTPLGMREIVLDPAPPYQPIQILDWRHDGKLMMDARLSNYRRVGDSGPYTARRYVINWPQSHAEMRLDINSAQFQPLPDIEGVFAFPDQFKGETEKIDAPSATGADGPTHP